MISCITKILSSFLKLVAKTLIVVANTVQDIPWYGFILQITSAIHAILFGLHSCMFPKHPGKVA